MKKLFFALLVSIISVGLFVSTAFAGSETVQFAWNQVISADFAGWKVYKSETAGGSYTHVTDIAYVTEQSEYTSEQVIVAPDGQVTTYYFVFTAFDTDGRESEYSNEVNHEFDFVVAPAAPFSLTITVVTD